MISKTKCDFFISKGRFCDIAKYEDFSTDERITPIKKKASAGVFPPTKMANRDAIGHLKCICALFAGAIIFPKN